MEEAALKDKRFRVMQDYCRFHNPVRIDGEWVDGCRCPSSVPSGTSFVVCEISSCPFYKRLFPRKRNNGKQKV